jgi:multiple sugar transport system substrate-binding protein
VAGPLTGRVGRVRSRLGLALALLPLLALLAACGGVGPGSGARGGDGRVSFLVFGDPEEIAAYRALVEAYARRHPDSPVDLVEASDRSDLLARLSTSIAGGSPPDVFLVNYRFYGQFAAKGAIAPVEERARASRTLDLAGYYPEALDAFRWRGALHCLPQNVSSLVVYYNRDLFRRYGVPEPADGWSWREFVATASALTRDAQGRQVAGVESEAATGVATYGVAVEPSIIRLAPFVWSNGGELVDDPDTPMRLTLDTPEAEQAVRELFALRAPYGVTPTDVEVEAEADEARFAHGRVAMVLSSRRSTTTFRSITGFTWDVAPLPYHREPAGILHSDAYCLARGAGDEDAAWRFVEFAAGPQGQPILARTGRTVPSLRAVAESPAFLDPTLPPRRARVFLDAIPTIRRVPSVSTWPEIEDAAAGILENGMYLGQPVGEVVAELDRVTRPLFARAEAP